MKIKSLFFLVTLLVAGRISAQTNQARMLSGTNSISVCPYTIQASDVTKLDVFTNSCSSVSLPAATTSGFGVGTIFSVKNDSSGSVIITPATGTISGAASYTLTTGQGADIYSTGTNYEIQPGAGSGGSSSVPWQNQGTTIGTPSNAINCSTNMTCSYNAGTVTLVSSATAATAWSSITGSATNTNTGFVVAPSSTSTVPWTHTCPSGITVDCYDWYLNTTKEMWLDSAGLLHLAQSPSFSITGNANTASNLLSYPTLCSGGQVSQGLSSGSNNCTTPPSGMVWPSGSGVPQIVSGASWGTTYNASNQIPASFIPFSAPGAIGSVTPSTGVFSALTDSALTNGYCVQAGSGGLLSSASAPCSGPGGGIINAVLSATSPTTSSFNVQGLPLGNGGAAVTSCPYTVQADTTGTTVDRGTVLVFNSSSSCAVTLQDPSVTGMGSSFAFNLVNIGAGTVTVTRGTAATFTVSTGSGVTTGGTSFTASQGQFARVHSDNSNWWVEENTGIAGTVATIAQGGTNATSAPSAGAIPNTSSTTASSWTVTPTLGLSGTPGTLSLYPASGNFTSTLGSAATASNTVNFFATAPTTGDVIKCVTSSTTCTLTDANGPIPSSLANATHKWLNSYTQSTGAFTQTQPSDTDLAGTTNGAELYVTSSAVAELATTAYSVKVSGATNPSWATPTANGQCFMSAASNYATTTPSFQGCPSGGGTTTNSLTMNNGGSGASSGSTFNGSSAVTISYNSIGAAPTASPTFTGTVTTPLTTAGLVTTTSGGVLGSSATVPNGDESTNTVTNSTGNASGANQIILSAGANKTVKAGSLADWKVFPAANCVSSTGGSAWSTSLTAACVGESNNVGGWLPFADASTAQFAFHLPADWDGNEPYINLVFDTATNASGTMIFQVQTGCIENNGSTTDNPTFSTAQVFSTATSAAANRIWSENLQFNAVTSGNSCVANGTVLVKITRNTDTASAVVGVTEADITLGRSPVVQAN
jgi:hypothetical protein